MFCVSRNKKKKLNRRGGKTSNDEGSARLILTTRRIEFTKKCSHISAVAQEREDLFEAGARGMNSSER